MNVIVRNPVGHFGLQDGEKFLVFGRSGKDREFLKIELNDGRHINVKLGVGPFGTFKEVVRAVV